MSKSEGLVLGGWPRRGPSGASGDPEGHESIGPTWFDVAEDLNLNKYAEHTCPLVQIALPAAPP